MSASRTDHHRASLPPAAAVGTPGRTARRGTRASSPLTADLEPPSPFRGLRWSLSFAAVLFYTFIITSYRIRIGDVVMAVALVGLVMESGSFRFSALLGYFAAFWSWCAIGVMSSSWPGVVKDELLVLGKLWLIVLALVNVLRGRRRVRAYMLFFVFIFAIYPVRGALFNYFLAGYGTFGRAIWNYVYSNPNDLAALTLLQLSIASAILVREPKGIYRLGALAALVVLPFLILLTQSRGVFIGLVAFGFVALAAHRKSARFIGLIAVVLLVSTMFLPSSAWNRLKSVAHIGNTAELSQIQDQGSAEQRFEIWKTAFRIIKDRPITGVGWGAYPQANAAYSPILGARDTHSTYFNVLAETGIPGFLLFIAMIVATVLHAERIRRRIRRLHPVGARQIFLLEAGLVGYLLASVFASNARLTFFYVHLVLIWAVAEANDVPHAPGRRRGLGRRMTAAPVTTGAAGG